MPKVLRSKGMSKCIGCFSCMNICAIFNQKNHSISKSAINIKTYGGMTGRFVATACRGCEEPGCMEVCPTGALTKRDGGGVLVNKEVCIGCQKCSTGCGARVIRYDVEDGKPIICKQCGLCANFCPHDCLTMEEVNA